MASGYKAIHSLIRKDQKYFSGSNKIIHKQSTMEIICGENEVAAKDNMKYLGVSLQQSLGGQYIAESI